MDLKRVLCIQREVLLEKQKKRSGEKISYQLAEAMVLGHLGRMGRNFGVEFFMEVRYSIFLLLCSDVVNLVLCQQGPQVP